MKALVTGLIASTLVIGAASQVEAANLTRSWDVVEAQKSAESKYSGGHAFWLPEMVSGGKFVFNSDALFNEYDDGSASFTGSIVAANNADLKWDFDIWFESAEEGWGGPKKELKDYAYVENGGTIDTNTWSYYDFSSTKTSTLSADMGTYAGQTLELSDFTNGGFPMQIGYGASGKNLEMGFSTWFKYEGSQNNSLKRHADINVNLIARELPDTQSVPEPTMGMLTLGLLGFVGSSLKRKKEDLK